MIKNNKAIALPFNWIFAIIVGTVILFLAIYAVSKFVGTSEKVSYTETGAKLVAVFESVGGIGSEKIEINFKDEVMVEFSCDELSNRPFGLQRINFGKVGKEVKGLEISIKDKYVFSEDVLEGKSWSIFSKPFYLGYKVSDLVIVSSGDYCFVDSPLVVLEEISGLELRGIKFVEDLDECSEGAIRVCFNGESCEIVVSSDADFKSGNIVKNGEDMFYVGNLIFAGIFSSSEIYECNVKRLVNRFKELALVYQEKVKLIEEKGCDSNIEDRLEGMRNLLLESSRDLSLFSMMGDNINQINNGQPEGCEVW